MAESTAAPEVEDVVTAKDLQRAIFIAILFVPVAAFISLVFVPWFRENIAP